MVVDSHTHIGDFPLFNVSLNVAELISIMDEWNVRTALVSTVLNQLTLEATRTYKDRIYGLVWVNPNNKKARELVNEAVSEWGFVGVKMHPLVDGYLPDDDLVHPLMEEASRCRVPILFHSGHPPWSLPWQFASLADAYPEVTIILGHMGHGHIVYINAAIDVAKKNENIMLETSAMPMHSKIREAVLEVGEDRVMYGSDTPFGHPAFEIKKVQVAGLTRNQLNMVLEENAERIFNLDKHT